MLVVIQIRMGTSEADEYESLRKADLHQSVIDLINVTVSIKIRSFRRTGHDENTIRVGAVRQAVIVIV